MGSVSGDGATRVHSGFGSYVDSERSIRTAVIHREFFTALHELVPSAFDRLMDESIIEAIDYGRVTPIGVLREHIEKWQRFYRLPDEWVMTVANNTILSYALHPAREIDSTCPYIVALIMPEKYSAIAGKPETFLMRSWTVQLSNMDDNHWEPTGETRASAKARIMAEMETHLDDALDVIERQEMERGALPTPSGKSKEHFRWLVRSEVMKQKPEVIASISGRDRKQVERAVRETAALVGLTLEPRKRGRPARSNARTAKMVH